MSCVRITGLVLYFISFGLCVGDGIHVEGWCYYTSEKADLSSAVLTWFFGNYGRDLFVPFRLYSTSPRNTKRVRFRLS